MKGCTISGSGTVGEGVFGVMTLGNELGRKEEAKRSLSMEGLSSFPCLAPESLFCFDLWSPWSFLIIAPVDLGGSAPSPGTCT